MAGYIDELKKVIGEELVTVNETILELHGRDESYHEPCLPDVVVFPRNKEDVSKVLKFANEQKIPVVPFGLGTSLEGHVIPVNGGISLDLSQMNAIVEVKESDFLVKVQPGVTRSVLNKELKKCGLFFTVDPGADATLGGMAATNASGTTSVRYGIMRDQVRDLEVVLANGDIIHTGSLAAKSSSGIHLNGMFVGSEGTLGVITELTLKVYGIPEAITAARAVFPSVKNAVDAVVSILAGGIPVARIEFVDAESVKKVNEYMETDYEESTTLFMEFHGNEAGLAQDVEFATEILKDHGCSDFQFEADSKARNQLWEARHNLLYAYKHTAGKKIIMLTDVSVPVSELTGAILHTRELIDASSIEGSIVGHVGDGNYHVLLLIDKENPEEVKDGDRINEEIVHYALKRGGTCTGEHGVGLGKAKYQRLEHGAAYEVMKSIKKTLDPNGILNPGKIFVD
ncbi:FAD-linked oxidase C-terminal domain-containing protein [Bacillus sp. ISL-55]|uniref:FAD-binding oxidoreductase n=1 Tax=Bacillus sp. ISL-55 TaxID=2819134 RepID=UPI001BE78BDF|nr:FAD-linked oxidase C-terminal domain-containing protein [Bacillus sp. ISL-55]MBT2693210.1 FAD-binding protein [Bacillus sp. ISL-55]